MATTAVTNERDGLTIGNVFGRSVAVIRSNPVATLGTTFVLIGLPQLAVSTIVERAAVLAVMGSATYGIVIAYGVTIAILWLIASGALVHATIAHDQGYRAPVGQAIRVGILRCLPLIGVYFLLILGVWAGSLFLLVPGIMLAVRWSVALPAIVAERTGVFGAFKRSSDLTEGARWPIFGLIVLAFVVYVLSLMVLPIIVGAGTGSLAAFTDPDVATRKSFGLSVVETVFMTASVTWLSTFGGALFVELRRWKDGPDADRLVDIFA